MATVYFLGAGASKSLEETFPLSSDLTINHLLDHSHYQSGSCPTAAIELIKAAVAAGRIGEDVCSQRLEWALGALPEMNPPHYDREQVLYCLWSRLVVPPHDNRTVPLKLFLSAALDEKSAILTTNYDSLIEWTLAHMESGVRPPGDLIEIDARGWIDYGLDETVRIVPDSERRQYELLGDDRGALPILKLHGSISWSLCSVCGTYNLDHIYMGGATDALGGVTRCQVKGCSGGRRHPVIVPPTLQKAYDDPAIKCIWRRARAILARASRLVFAGFSLDPSDLAIRNLLREARDTGSVRAVLVIDPRASCSLWRRYCRVFGFTVRMRRATWSEYLDEEFTLQSFGARMDQRRKMGLVVR